jgi:MFS family permease/predicted O-methyltransferase YrrM
MDQVAAEPQRREGWLRADFAITILTSAFLLFQVQPLISKFILPWFGGSPAVWTTCMLFFQVVLFAGYAYAHLTSKVLAPRWQGIVHLGLLLLAVATLPIAPAPSWKPNGSGLPTWRILALLATNVGLPYFALSSTGPLVQAWWSRAFPGRSPYRLYALSNLGSLLALLSYPFVFEPVLDVVTHSKLWSWGFAVFVLPCGAAALALGKLRARAPTSPEARGDAPAPRWHQRALWLALPAAATLMLLATTNHVCQQVAVVPFLWVVPLSLYLLTFIIAFDHERWYARRTFCVLALVLTLAMAGIRPLDRLLEGLHYDMGFAEQLVIFFGALFSICMVCHGELVRLRPSPRHLTEFYLMISAGGALGGALVSLVAPAVFASFFEWKIGLVVSFLLAAVVLLRATHAAVPKLARAGLGVVLLGGVGCIGVFQTDNDAPVALTRNFYGALEVSESNKDEPDEHFLSMIHGLTVHGRQYVAPAKRALPLTYYGPASGVGRTLDFLRARGAFRAGAVGLGVGTVSSYVRAGDELTFYELNPDVERLARQYFTYLGDAAGSVRVELGDARLTLERASPQGLHLLILDAFTGDAPPAHLLTREAMAIYMRHLRDDGVIAVHITNWRVDLMPVLVGLAKAYDLKVVRRYAESDMDKLWYHSDWVMLTRNADFVAALPDVPPPEAGKDRPPVLWTDHYNNLFALLK